MSVRRLRLLLLAGLGMGIGVACAADFKSGDRVVVTETDTLQRDLYASGRFIDIAGVALHDLVLAAERIKCAGRVEESMYAAAAEIFLTGSVRGDILAVGGELELGGTAESSIRAAGGTITIQGTVYGDVVAAGNRLKVMREAVIYGDLIFAGGECRMEGALHGKLTAAVDHLELTGSVGRDVELTLGRSLALAPGAQVAGDLRYRAPHPLEIDNQQAIAGNIEFQQLKPDPGSMVFRWLLRIGFWLACLAAGGLMIAIGRGRVQNALDRTLHRPLDTLAAGAIALVGTPIAAVLALALVITIPVGLILIIGLLVFTFFGVLIFGTFVGREILRLLGRAQPGLGLPMLAGVTLVVAATWIPHASSIFWLVIVIAGLGSVALGAYEALRTTPRTGSAQ